ncbi:MAG: RsmD family RNA methyltransferase [Euryarchaeota archaeon]|nr:RsmD family RNA methyltransferase [Euryarchaeota archaeon]
MRLLFWYSGEHAEMPQEEARAVFQAHGFTFDVVGDRPRFQVVDTDALGVDVDAIVRRLGLTHDVSSHLFDGVLDERAVAEAADLCCFATGIRFAVRAERLGEGGGLRRTEVERRVGEALGARRTVNLKRPEVVVRAFLDGERVWVGQRLWDRDPKETAQRHPKERPEFSPVSLQPKLARALVNLARVPSGGVVYDPFCGTGGVLLEAASMGLRVVGSDLDEAMVRACRTNLEHFGLGALDLFPADAGIAAKELARRGLPAIDAVVSDLPYGRSAYAGKEPLERLYERAFQTMAQCVRPGGFVVAGVPTEAAARRIPSELASVALFKVPVHRSLTRHFALLRRPPA